MSPDGDVFPLVNYKPACQQASQPASKQPAASSVVGVKKRRPIIKATGKKEKGKRMKGQTRNKHTKTQTQRKVWKDEEKDLRR